MQCEVCGNQIIGKPHRVIIEGAKMTTCVKCAQLGSSDWEPPTLRHAASRRLGVRTGSAPAKKRTTVAVPEDLVVTEDFGSIVRQARLKSGLSQEDLGKEIREKVSVIRKVESGKMVPDNRLAGKLEHALGIKLLVQLVEPQVSISGSSSDRSLTLGEIVHLKGSRRRGQENEGGRSLSERQH